MLLYIMLYIVLAYLMLFAALTNASSSFFIDLCKCFLFSCFVFVNLNFLFASCTVLLICLFFLIICSHRCCCVFIIIIIFFNIFFYERAMSSPEK